MSERAKDDSEPRKIDKLACTKTAAAAAAASLSFHLIVLLCVRCAILIILLQLLSLRCCRASASAMSSRRTTHGFACNVGKQERKIKVLVIIMYAVCVCGMCVIIKKRQVYGENKHDCVRLCEYVCVRSCCVYYSHYASHVSSLFDVDFRHKPK